MGRSISSGDIKTKRERKRERERERERRRKIFTQISSPILEPGEIYIYIQEPKKQAIVHGGQ